MKLKSKKLGLKTGDVFVVVIDDKDAIKLGLEPGDRVLVHVVKEDGTLSKGKHAIIDYATADGFVDQGEIGLFDEIWHSLGIEKKGTKVYLQSTSKPQSYDAIRSKIDGKELSKEEVFSIIN